MSYIFLIFISFTLTVTYFDSTTLNYCQDIDSVYVGDLQISASGSNLTANLSYSTSICLNAYPNSYLWSTGDTTKQ